MKRRIGERRESLDRASVLAWAAWLGYTLACAWPAFDWPVAWWVYPALCLGYGLLACLGGSAFLAGAAGACASAPLLRIATDDYGLICAGVGFILAGVSASMVLLVNAPVDARGQMPARASATLLWLATTGAGVWGLLLADAVAFMSGGR
jgi:hypothetical protein